MLNRNKSGLEPDNQGFLRFFPVILLGAYVVMSLIWAFSTHATWDDDCPTRGYNALHAFSEPIQFISPWNRPLFILLFAIPVQLGFWTIPVVMTAISALSAWLLYKALEHLKVANAALVIPFFLFQTYAFVISHNALTEPLAMAIIAIGFWAMVKEKWALFGFLGGLLVLARLELVLLLPLWAFVLVRAKHWLPVLYLALPFLLWNLAGGLLTGDWAYVFSSTLGAAGEESRYGSTPLEHYFMRYIYVTGPVVLFFAVLGLMSRIAHKRLNWLVDAQFAIGFMIYVGVSALVAAGNSAGFLRNLIPVTPLAAILALDGFNVFMRTAKAGANPSPETRNDTWIVLGWSVTLLMLCALVFNMPLKMHMIPDAERTFWANTVFVGAVLAIWLAVNTFFKANRNASLVVGCCVAALIISFTAFAEPPGANDSMERQIVEEVGRRVKPMIKDGSPLYVNHIWYFWSQGKDPKANDTRPVTKLALNTAPSGAVVFWDLHYSPRLGGDVGLDFFDAQPEWTELLSFRNAEENFLAKVFRKGSRGKDATFSASESFVSQHPQDHAALAAAGNVRARWADYEGAIQFFQRANQVNDMDPDVWFGLGLSYLKLREIPQAERALTIARDLDPKLASVWFNLAAVHAAMDRDDEAINELNQCLAIQPGFVNAYFARGAIYGRQGRMDAAIADFSQALALQPDHMEARFNRGATYAMMKRYDAAIPDLQAALKQYPGNPDGWLFLGKSQAATKDIPGACESFRKAQSLGHPNAAELIQMHCP